MENNAFEFRAVKQSVSSKEAAATLKVNIETIYKVIQVIDNLAYLIYQRYLTTRVFLLTEII